MGRYEIILEKVPINNTEPKKEIVKESPNLSIPRYPSLHELQHLDMFTPRREAWFPPMPINETRRLNRFSFLHDPSIATQIETISHMCFEAISRTSEENNRLLPRLGYHRFRPLVMNSAREFFVLGDTFLMWQDDDIVILNPDHVQVRYNHHNNLEYFLSGMENQYNPQTHVGSRIRLENVFHLSRRVLHFDHIGTSIIMRNANDPAYCEIPNIGHERYVSQFVDSWVNSNIMLGENL